MLLCAADIGVADVVGRHAERQGRLERECGFMDREQHIPGPHTVEPGNKSGPSTRVRSQSPVSRALSSHRLSAMPLSSATGSGRASDLPMT